MSTLKKLNNILSAKKDIRQALEERGVVVDDDLTGYAAAIESVPTGVQPQNRSVTVDANRLTYTITPEEGYNSIHRVDVTVSTPVVLPENSKFGYTGWKINPYELLSSPEYIKPGYPGRVFVYGLNKTAANDFCNGTISKIIPHSQAIQVCDGAFWPWVEASESVGSKILGETQPWAIFYFDSSHLEDVDVSAFCTYDYYIVADGVRIMMNLIENNTGGFPCLDYINGGCISTLAMENRQVVTQGYYAYLYIHLRFSDNATIAGKLYFSGINANWAIFENIPEGKSLSDLFYSQWTECPFANVYIDGLGGIIPHIHYFSPLKGVGRIWLGRLPVMPANIQLTSVYQSNPGLDKSFCLQLMDILPSTTNRYTITIPTKIYKTITEDEKARFSAKGWNLAAL